MLEPTYCPPLMRRGKKNKIKEQNSEAPSIRRLASEMVKVALPSRIEIDPRLARVCVLGRTAWGYAPTWPFSLPWKGATLSQPLQEGEFWLLPACALPASKALGLSPGTLSSCRREPNSISFRKDRLFGALRLLSMNYRYIIPPISEKSSI